MITPVELEQRWKNSFKTISTGNFHSLLLSSDCVPDLFIAKDAAGQRYLILQLPKGFVVSEDSLRLEHLELIVQPEKRRILIGLRHAGYNDIFNDLILSLYNRIKHRARAEDCAAEFVACFNQWATFFDMPESALLPKDEIQGLFGEIIVLRHLLIQNSLSPSETASAWQGPYGKAQDFVFPSHNLEVKTIETGQATIRISSEHQLQSEIGKGLQLGIVTVQLHSDGITLDSLCSEIRRMIVSMGADVTLFLASLLRAGIAPASCPEYDCYRWKPLTLTFYDCGHITTFPRIISSDIHSGISSVKYQLAVNAISDFAIQTYPL